VGGLAVVANELADDYALGAAVRRLGRSVVLSPHLVDNVIAEPSLGALVHHELRWARTVRSITPSGFFGSILTHPVILAILALPLGDSMALGVGLAGFAIACRCLMVRMVDRALGLPPTPLWLLPVRDLLSFVVFVASFFSRTVAWRDRTFRVDRDGQLILDGDRTA
jgi:ceramide glucosyltransferase